MLKNKTLKQSYNKLTSAVLAIFLMAFVFYPYLASAAALTAVSDTQTRLKEGTLSSHDILFTLVGSNTFAAGETITIDFGEDDSKYTVAGSTTTAGDFDFNDGTERVIYSYTNGSADCTGSSGVNDVAIGINDTTGVLTVLACPSFTASGAAATANLEYGTAATTGGSGTNRVTNPATQGTYVINIAGTFGDSGSFATAILDTADDDQVTLNATVDPSITFALSAHVSNFNTLAPGVVDTADTNITLTIGTNGNGGYTVNVKDAGSGSNPGLWNATASAIIGSADASYNATADLTAVSVGYGLQASCTAGCTTATDITSDFRQGSDTVGGVTLADKLLANYTSAPTANHTIAIVHKAKAATFTKAGSYTDVLTYIATGRF